MRRLATLPLLFALSACASTSTAPKSAQAPVELGLLTSDAEPLINRSEVVAIVASVDVASNLEQDAARWGYDLKRKEPLDGLGLWLLTFDCPPGIDPEVASLELERLAPRSEVEVNHRFTLSAATTEKLRTTSSRNYAHDLINWPEDGCEARMRLGMIDGEVDADALPNTRISARSFVNGAASNSSRKHGTAIAKLLVGEGRLRNADLFSASVVSVDGAGHAYSGVESILRALDWMAQENVRVVNISLAGPANQTLTKGFRRAADKGMVVVAAVGNSGPTSRPRYPAALPSVIAATAVDSAGHIYPDAVRGRHIDISAPGVDVYIPSDDGGRYETGTSIAAPFVSAALAAKRLPDQPLKPKALVELLMPNANDLGPDGRDDIFGLGLMNAKDSCG